MLHLVLAYRRSTQTLLESEEFRNWEDASSHRSTLDKKYWGERDVEVVTLVGDSIESMHETHGRYFVSMKELLERARSALPTGRRAILRRHREHHHDRVLQHT